MKNERLRRENAELRSRIEHLERVDTERQATLQTLQDRLELLQEQNALLRKALFSPKRERFIPSADQKLLFQPESLDGDEATTDDDEEPDENSQPEPDDASVPRKKRRPRRKRFEFPQCLPVKRVEYPLSPEELASRYGHDQWEVVKEIVSRRLEYVEPSAHVLEEVRFVYASKTNDENESLVTSDKPSSINDKGIFGSSMIAYLAESKFERHLPLYRLQEDLQATTTMWFSRSVLSSALVRAGRRLRPLRDLMLFQILESYYLRVDETTARVLRPGTGSTDLVYLWIYVGDNDYPYQVFDYRLDRSRAGPAEILAGYQGGLLTDGYSVYTSLVKESDGRLLDLGCWAHARRKFDESCVVTAHPLAHDALAWIWQLFDIEDRVVDAKPEVRLETRQRESVPILARLHERLVEAQPTVRPSSKLYEAIGYLLNRWKAMTRFTTDARYAIDNNAAERSIRPSVLGRKNYLFFGSDQGGHAGCAWYTIIQSARYNHLHVMPYLNDVLVRLPEIVPEYLRVGDAESPFDSLTGDQREALSELLPDRWLKAHPEHRCEDRQRELDEANQRRRRRRARRRSAVKA